MEWSSHVFPLLSPTKFWWHDFPPLFWAFYIKLSFFIFKLITLNKDVQQRLFQNELRQLLNSNKTKFLKSINTTNSTALNPYSPCWSYRLTPDWPSQYSFTKSGECVYKWTQIGKAFHLTQPNLPIRLVPINHFYELAITWQFFTDHPHLTTKSGWSWR